MEGCFLILWGGFGLPGEVFGLVTVGGNIFAAMRESGVLMNKNLKVLKTFKFPHESTSRVSALGNSKVVILGNNSFIIDLETEEITGLTKNDYLMQVLTFPSGKVLLVIETRRVPMTGALMSIGTKMVIYKDNTFEGLLGKFTKTETVSTVNYVPPTYAVLDEMKLLATGEGKLRILNVNNLLFESRRVSKPSEESQEPEIECEFLGSDFGSRISPIDLPGHEEQETAFFTQFMLDYSPLNRDIARIVVKFV